MVTFSYFHCYFSDNVIAEGDEEQEDYDDVDDDLKAQILGRANGGQEKQPTTEEDGGNLISVFLVISAYIYFMNK